MSIVLTNNIVKVPDLLALSELQPHRFVQSVSEKAPDTGFDAKAHFVRTSDDVGSESARSPVESGGKFGIVCSTRSDELQFLVHHQYRVETRGFRSKHRSQCKTNNNNF
jgi:hypothetical protein